MAGQIPKKELCFGILTPSVQQFECWKVDAIERLCAINGVKCVLFLFDDRQDHFGDLSPRKNNRCLAFRRYLLYLKKHSKTLQARTLPNELTDIPTLVCDTSMEGFTDEVLYKIKAHHLDFLLTFRRDHPSDKLIEAFQQGVWSFSSRGMDGKMSAFQAILAREKIMAVRLWRLGTRSEVDELLEEGVFSVIHHSFLDTLDKAQSLSRDWPARSCQRILNSQASHHEKRVLPGEKRKHGCEIPSTIDFLRFRLRLLFNKFQKLWQALAFEQWNVGILQIPIQTWLETLPYDDVHWLAQSRNQSFLADPFAIQTGSNQLTILAEEYDCRVGRGVISAFECSVNGEEIRRKPGVMCLPVHMSYPYLFKHGGNIYCIPETYQAGGIDLYQATDFPDQWEKVTTLVEEFSGVDATVFQYGDNWWLFCTDSNRDPHGSLCAWYSASLLGPWKPHSMNPIKTDVRSSRPAGVPFWHHGELFRPAQDCSRTYGGQIAMNKIRVLTPTEFQEEVVKVVTPPTEGPYQMGVHTLSTVGEFTVIDGKRRVRSVAYVLFKLLGYYQYLVCRFRKASPTQVSQLQKSSQ